MRAIKFMCSVGRTSNDEPFPVMAYTPDEAAKKFARIFDESTVTYGYINGTRSHVHVEWELPEHVATNAEKRNEQVYRIEAEIHYEYTPHTDTPE